MWTWRAAAAWTSASARSFRQRLALLDEDDHVATLLSLRNNVRQLESRVAVLQLKLASMPSALAKPGAPAASPAPSAKAAPASQAEAAPRRAPPTTRPGGRGTSPTPGRGELLVIALLAAVLNAPAAPRRNGTGIPPRARLLLRRRPREMPPVCRSEDSLRPRPAASPAPGPQRRCRKTRASCAAATSRSASRKSPTAPWCSKTRRPSSRARACSTRTARPRARWSCSSSASRTIRARCGPGRALRDLPARRQRRRVRRAGAALPWPPWRGSEHWRKVRYFGREIDPANPLYREDSPTTASFDPIEENWLDAPMDFENAAWPTSCAAHAARAGFGERARPGAEPDAGVARRRDLPGGVMDTRHHRAVGPCCGSNGARRGFARAVSRGHCASSAGRTSSSRSSGCRVDPGRGAFPGAAVPRPGRFSCGSRSPFRRPTATSRSMSSAPPRVGQRFQRFLRKRGAWATTVASRRWSPG